ncbi:MAG: hypothetical protein GX853_09705, partial [Chloroflexi bacterium]|nr:hypothetical protein [Chloroflexota bacterium]
VNDLLAAQPAGRLSHAMRKYISPTLVCIAELGYLPLGKDGCNLLFQVFSCCLPSKMAVFLPFKMAVSGLVSMRHRVLRPWKRTF